MRLIRTRFLFLAIMVCNLLPAGCAAHKKHVSLAERPAPVAEVTEQQALCIASEEFKKQGFWSFAPYQITIADGPDKRRWVVMFYGQDLGAPRPVLHMVLVNKSDGSAAFVAGH